MNYFDFCMFTKVMRCVQHTTAFVNIMIVIIGCIHWDCMLLVRKIFCYLPLRLCKKVVNQWCIV